MAKTYNLSATIRPGWRSTWYENGKDYSSAASLIGDNNRNWVGKFNGDSRVVSLGFTMPSIVSGASIMSIKLNVTIGSGTVADNTNYQIQYKKTSSTSDWEGTGTVVGYIKSASGNSISSTMFPSNGLTIVPSSSSLNAAIEITAATLVVVTNENDYSYTLAYNANGGSGAPSNQTGTSVGASPSYTFTISTTAPTRTGHTFLGWSKSSTATSASYYGGVTLTVTSAGTTTLYAVWQIKTYTITYNKGTHGTGTNTSATKTYNVALTLKGAIFTRTGYTQKGWSTAADGTSKAYNLSASYTANTNKTLYPYWEANTYAVTYNANGGSGAPSAQTKTYNVTLTLSSTTPTRTGYTFTGWSTSNTATTATYSAGGSYTANASATLYAVWQAVTYTVSYNKGANGTGTNTSATKTYNVALTLKGGIFTRTGYTQTGWATSDGGAQAYALSASYTANAAVTLYPVWTAGKSTVSTTNGTLGTAQTITITRYSASYTHTLTYKYGSATGTIVTKTSSTTPSWTPATSLASQFPSATSGTCTITCETFNGDTSIGTTTTTCTLSIPSSIKATISSVSLSETVSGIASQFGGFVQNKSKSKVTVNTSTANAGGATVKSYSITINGQTLTSNNATTSLLTTSGSNSYTARITDTRGRTSESTGTFTVLAYNAPSVSETAQRNATTTTTINVSYSWTISAVNNNNTKTIRIKYRTFGSSSAATTATTITPSAYSGSGSYAITGLDADTAYDVWVEVTDYFGTASATSTVAGNANRIYHISHTDKTVARHGANPADGWDHQFFNERFHGVVDVTNRRCDAILSNAGWHRAISYPLCTSADELQGYVNLALDIGISRYGDLGESHRIKLFLAYGHISFADEESASRLMRIDKIRYTYDSNYGYIDIHTTVASSVRTAVRFDVVSGRQTYTSRFVAESLQDVVDAPSGETIAATYDFHANGTYIDNLYATTLNGIFGVESITIANNATGTVSIPNNGGVLIVSHSTYANGRYLLIAHANNSGTVYYTAINTTTTTFATSTNALSITNTSGGTAFVTILRV